VGIICEVDLLQHNYTKQPSTTTTTTTTNEEKKKK